MTPVSRAGDRRPAAGKSGKPAEQGSFAAIAREVAHCLGQRRLHDFLRRLDPLFSRGSASGTPAENTP
jgi:hypothetical protein